MRGCMGGHVSTLCGKRAARTPHTWKKCQFLILLPRAHPLHRDALDQPLPVLAAANESFKKAKALGLGDSDFSAVYEAAASGGASGSGAKNGSA